ncbi:MAG: hypothetical protein COB67_01490 [SAR324 cluster bacterium]|uniref:DNA-directed RNA polymerase subunit omega n=1 Tax=SAR324 cluster bacterium TaxID=2024889 RepID=A0A2A4TAB0_9DELT|nr:MAG: hypothetical protein COB67_01490 [SAR324 cluster bacterium]
MNYLDLVEEYTREGVVKVSQFDKIHTLVNRAKDLYEGKTSTLRRMDGRKPTAIAQVELNIGLIETNIYDKLEDDDVSTDDDLYAE